jgi:type VI secretion system secreted protein Hcp
MERENRVKKILRAVLLVLCFVAFAGVGQAMAQDTFMLVPGIKGSATDARHRDWIDVLSLSQTLDQVAGRPQCTLNATKLLDISGPLLWGAAVTGKVFPQIRIEVVSAGERPQIFYQITLTNAVVTGISTSGSSGGFVELVTLSATSVQLKFFPQRADGSLGSPVTSTFTC